MQGIVEIEEPFEEFVDAGVFSALAVVAGQQRQGQRNGQLQNAVELVEREEIHDRVERHKKQHPPPLHLQIASVRAEGQHAQACDAAPVAREADQTDENDEKRLLQLRKALAVRDAQHDKPPRKRPHDARLVQDAPKVKRDERAGVHKVVGRETIRKMRNDGEQEQPEGVFMDIPRVIIALGDKIAHDGAGQTADDVHHDRQRPFGIAGEEQPRDMVDRHGKNRDQLQLIGVQRLFHICSPIGKSPACRAFCMS